MLKKSLAIAGSLLLVTSNLLVGVVHADAGALNDLTATYDDASGGNDAYIVITSTAGFASATPSVTRSVEKCTVGGTCSEITNGEYTESNDDGSQNTIKIVDSSLNGLTDGNYTVRFTTSDGDFGAATFVIGDANKVTLTAKVLPILLFNISTNSLDFGTLTPTAVSSQQFNVTLSTNAANGATVKIQVNGDGTNPGLYDSVSSHLIQAGSSSVTAGTEGMKIYVDTSSLSSSDGVAPTTSVGESTNGVTSTSETDILSVTAPTDTAAATIKTDVAISNITPAGNYQTIYTLTVTANF